MGRLGFPESRDWYKERLVVREGGTFLDVMLCIRSPLLYLGLSLKGRIDKIIIIIIHTFSTALFPAE